ncbi:glycosyltransferase family 2 protein [Candidatus Magnetobacterium casense]|uniref:Glycosyltransferase family 2 protein n=1 Tax=Candidatus Magnetobacterium casense TaxID=1455061 RepID=A0ABS6RWV8_9BACT|nr:glycosyltransferase family 2 protein [Candidatus Magnetobacterium casensis]MBV6340278.1 glycosyltransferase family 2 protein [Candidatus Magnetobacterium casensis]
MTDRLPVSVVIVTKNEELNIAGALESACMAQEIVIVDDYSTDRTVDICRAYNARVYQNHWQGFAQQKQLAIDHAQGPWVFLLDSDERVTPALVQELGQVLTEAAYDGFYVPRKNFFLGKWIKHGGWWPDNTLRLFKKDKAHMHQRQVHEKVLLDGRTGNLRNPIEHYSYKDISDFIRRMDVYTALAAEEVVKAPVRSYAFAFTLKPLAMFLKMYAMRLGFLDGVRGFILAVLYAFYTFLKYLKAWEKESGGEKKL